jgi:hypothetical protein
MVAAALGGRVDRSSPSRSIVCWTNEDGDESAIILYELIISDHVRAIKQLARRLREAEQERDRLATAGQHWRGLATSDRGTGRSGWMVAMPADYCTGGYRVATALPVPEPACDPLEPCDGTASVAVKEWWDAQRDFA